VPPIFHALIDVAHDMVPTPLEPAVYGLPLWPIRPPAARSFKPVAGLQAAARLAPKSYGQCRLSPGRPEPGGPKEVWAGSASSAWPAPQPALPRLLLRPGKPAVPPLPRHVALRLPLLDRWNPQLSEPAMFLGVSARW
jgi:hypothetical protein